MTPYLEVQPLKQVLGSPAKAQRPDEAFSEDFVGICRVFSGTLRPNSRVYIGQDKPDEQDGLGFRVQGLRFRVPLGTTSSMSLL